MKVSGHSAVGICALTLCVAGTGCREIHPSPTGSPYHPGPVVGRGVGAGVGVVAGNVAGAAVGFGEGVAGGVAAPFDNTTHVVRHWHTETTADGRTVQVPEDILVDRYGRPVYSSSPNTQTSQPLASPRNQNQ
jgi:hypothetical protein